MKIFIKMLVFLLACMLVFTGCNTKETSDIKTVIDTLEDLQTKINDMQTQIDNIKTDITVKEEESQDIGLPEEVGSQDSTPNDQPSDPPSPPPTGPQMFSSDALFVGFNPVTGEAQLDFIEILQGSAAVQYMVSNQGKTLQEAQDEVDDWADSECIVKNDNPQLRTVDLKNIDIKMLFYPDGSEDYTLNGVVFSYNDFINLYNNYPERIEYYLFYHLDVDNSGNVVELRQVYWP